MPFEAPGEIPMEPPFYVLVVRATEAKTAHLSASIFIQQFATKDLEQTYKERSDEFVLGTDV